MTGIQAVKTAASRLLTRTLEVVGLTSLVVAIGLPAGIAAAATPDSVRTGGRPLIDYVALGDSYASGVGAGDYDPGSDKCLRSTSAYPARWARIKAKTFIFAACSGATTAEVGQQIQHLGTHTDLVTISVGGNDAGFSDVLAACRFGGDEQCAAAVQEGTRIVQDVLPTRLSQLFQRIRAAAPRADVIVMGYPRLFERGSCSGDDISDARRGQVNTGADALAAVTEKVAGAAGFVFVDTRDEFAGHGVCSGTPWINALREPGHDSYHPNKMGHLEAFLAALLKETDYPV